MTVQSQTYNFCLKFAQLWNNNCWNHFQLVYCTRHRTKTTLLRIVNNLLNVMDEDKISVLLLLDLSAAIDTINHQILLFHLKTVFGIHSTALHWFWSKLSTGQKVWTNEVSNNHLSDLCQTITWFVSNDHLSVSNKITWFVSSYHLSHV